MADLSYGCPEGRPKAKIAALNYGGGQNRLRKQNMIKAEHDKTKIDRTEY